MKKQTRFILRTSLQSLGIVFLIFFAMAFACDNDRKTGSDENNPRQRTTNNQPPKPPASAQPSRIAAELRQFWHSVEQSPDTLDSKRVVLPRSPLDTRVAAAHQRELFSLSGPEICHYLCHSCSIAGWFPGRPAQSASPSPVAAQSP